MGDNFYGCGFFKKPYIDKTQEFFERIEVCLYKHRHCDLWYLAFDGNGWELFHDPMHGRFSGRGYAHQSYPIDNLTKARMEEIQRAFEVINEKYANSNIGAIAYPLEELYLYSSLANLLEQDFIFASTDDESLDVAGLFRGSELAKFGWRDETLSLFLDGDELTISPVLTEEHMIEFDDASDTPVWNMESEPVNLSRHVAQMYGGVAGTVVDLEMKDPFSHEILSTTHPDIFEKVGGFSSEILFDLENDLQKLE